MLLFPHVPLNRFGVCNTPKRLAGKAGGADRTTAPVALRGVLAPLLCTTEKREFKGVCMGLKV